jgi:hypothetical protein
VVLVTVSTLPIWFQDTVSVVRAGVRTDRYGDESEDWDSPTVTEITDCKVTPVAGGPEDQGVLDDRDALTKRWALAAPPGTDIRSTDRIRWNGTDYAVEGDPLVWKSPFGSVDHLYVQLVRVEG